jgi:hypothetical protein
MDARTRARHLTPVPDSRIEHDAMQWKLFQAYMALGINFNITLCTVSISFDRRVEAEEFRRFAMQARKASA